MKLNLLIFGLFAVFVVSGCTFFPSSENSDNKEVTIKNLKIAQSFVENSPTYKFDGSNIEFFSSRDLNCENCFEYVFVFESENSGFGDRLGEELDGIVTMHSANLVIENDKVKSANIDLLWDIINQETISDNVVLVAGQKPDGVFSVSEFLASGRQWETVEVYGKIQKLKELDCPCFEIEDDFGKLKVQYDDLTDDTGITIDSVDVSGFKNEDAVILTGALMENEIFWLSAIKKS